MVKRSCSIALSEEVIQYINRNKGVFSFSAYTEHLIRLGINREPVPRKILEDRGEDRNAYTRTPVRIR